MKLSQERGFANAARPCDEDKAVLRLRFNALPQRLKFVNPVSEKLGLTLPKLLAFSRHAIDLVLMFHSQISVHLHTLRATQQASFTVHLLPLLQHNSSRPILPVRLHLLLLQHAERLPREIRSIHLLRIEHVPQLIPREAIQPRIIRIEFRPQLCPPLLVPLERRKREVGSRE